MILLRRYDCVWGIQIGKVEGEIKTEGVGVMADVKDDNTALTAELYALNSDKEGSDSSDKEDWHRRTNHARGRRPFSTGETVCQRACWQMKRSGHWRERG